MTGTYGRREQAGTAPEAGVCQPGRGDPVNGPEHVFDAADVTWADVAWDWGDVVFVPDGVPLSVHVDEEAVTVTVGDDEGEDEAGGVYLGWPGVEVTADGRMTMSLMPDRPAEAEEA